MVITQFIHKFTKDGKYRINIPLKDIEYTINTYINEYGLNLDPDFQRDYIWTLEQKQNYIIFLARGGQSSREIYFNHPGWMNNFKGDMVIVDGKQRLSACIEFIQNKFSIFGHFFKEFDYFTFGPIDPSLVFNINDLKNRKYVLQWYLDLNTGGTIHTNDELDNVRKLIELEK